MLNEMHTLAYKWLNLSHIEQMKENAFGWWPYWFLVIAFEQIEELQQQFQRIEELEERVMELENHGNTSKTR